MQLKPINEQVVVVVGAASGIGRESALRLAGRGAKVVVAARGEPGISGLADEINARGGEAVAVACDVADFAQVKAVAETAAATFGRIDTWVNVAAVSVYARFEETTLDEIRRTMDVNFMGQVHGAKAALPYLRQEGRGALIAISSVESMVSLPLHSAYAASKHAVEGVFDALRRELLAEGVPISVTSIKPATIDTPFFANARDKLGVKPQGPPPVYDPVVVAECVLYAAEHPVRDLYAGGAARMMTLGQALAPGLIDAALSRFGIEAQRTDVPEPAGTPGNLLAPTMDYRVDGGDSRSRPFSLYTWLETHPEARALVNAGLAAGAMYVARSLFANPPAPSMEAGNRYGNGMPAAR